MKKLTIVTLTYNQLERATKPYIESLYKYTNIEDFDLILVDNNSTDGTVEYLKELQTKYNNRKYFFEKHPIAEYIWKNRRTSVFKDMAKYIKDSFY